MLSLGIGEIVVIAALMLLVVGPERLPTLMRWAGRSYGQVRRMADEMRRAFMLEADRQEAEERYAKMLEQRQRLRAEREAAAADPDSVDPEAAVPYEEDLAPAQASEPAEKDVPHER